MTRGRDRGPRPATIAVAAFTLAILAGACTAGPSPTPAPISTASIVGPASGGPGESASVPASPVTGVLTHIDSGGLSKVTGFRLRIDDGTELTFVLGALENGVEFPPGHLAEHLATSSPIRVFFRVEGRNLVVYRLEDAAP